MILKAPVALPLLLTLGCLAAPREVETTLELGAQKVEITVRLKDIRTSAPDELNQLRVFNEFSTWDPAWINELPWAPAATRFEYASDGGSLELLMHASMTRADFDKCARAPADAGLCVDFPVELGKAGYAVRPEVLALKSLVIDPRQKASWPADAGRIGYRVGLSASEEQFIDVGPSLARGFAIHRSAPAVASQTMKKIEASEQVFLQGSLADWTKELSALDACTEQPWCALRQEAARREQLRLVFGYLSTRPEAGFELRAPPERHIEFLGGGLGKLLPKDALSPIDELRLRIRYDVQLEAFRGKGWLAADAWQTVCRPDTMKKPSLKDFCSRLGVRPKK